MYPTSAINDVAVSLRKQTWRPQPVQDLR
jgi:hypothetical protein